MLKLGVMIASVREGRGGSAVADWFVALARKHGGFDVEVLDLKEVDLPLLSEPAHPRLQKYTHEKTKAWSARVAAMDAFVFVTPEYNFNMPPSLVNALDHLYHEWSYKACSLVSYGGASGGMRAAQQARQMVTAFKMVAIVEAVAIPFFSQLMENGVFKGAEVHDKAVGPMLDELLKWTEALRPLRV